MTIWTPQGLGDDLSGIVTKDDGQDEAILSLQRGTTEPTTKPYGVLWCRTDYPTLGEVIQRYGADNAWHLLMDVDFAQVNAGGTVPFAANQSMGGNKLTGLAAATANGEAVRYEQAVRTTGLVANLAAAGFKLTGLGAPSAAGDSANKQYVDDGVVCGLSDMSDGTDPDRTLSVGGLGFAPRIILVQLNEYGNPSAVTSEMVMSAAYGVGSAPTPWITMRCLNTTGALLTVTSRCTILRNAGGFTFTYPAPLRANGTYAPNGTCMWVAIR